MKQLAICVLLVAFLGIVSNPHTALAMGSSEMSYETVGLITAVCVVAVIGAFYLTKKHEAGAQEKDQQKSCEKKEEARKQRQKAFIHGGEMALIRW